MPRLSMWNERKQEDYRFFDNQIKDQFYHGGTAILVHKYLGPSDGGPDGDGGDETTIQDLLWLENRDRKYDPDVYELRGTYNVQDNDFDLSQWGLMLPNDLLFISFHINDTIDRLGRKLMSGDVLELPHLREDALLDEDAPAVNKFYVIQDISRAAEGFSPTWFPHIIRAKVKPLEDSQEFREIVGDEGGEDSIFDILSTYQSELDINDAWFEKAVECTPHRNFETAHFYVVESEAEHGDFPWIFAGDGIPPNQSTPANSGRSFPMDPEEGEYFLNTGYEPNLLFRRVDTKWIRLETDWQKTWSAANRILESFINNDNVTVFNTGDVDEEKQMLSKAIKPKADF